MVYLINKSRVGVKEKTEEFPLLRLSLDIEGKLIPANKSDSVRKYAANAISDLEGDDSDTSTTNSDASSTRTIPSSALGCTSGVDCTDTNCCGSDTDGNDDDSATRSSSLIRGQHIHISGGFTIPQSSLIKELEDFGAAGVKKGTNLGKATILIKGINCKDVLLRRAEERNNVLVLNEVELIARLRRDGCSLSSITNATTVIDESKLADELIKKCTFESVDRLSGVRLKTKCDNILPTELTTCYDDDEAVVEYGDHNFTDTRIRNFRGNYRMR